MKLVLKNSELCSVHYPRTNITGLVDWTINKAYVSDNSGDPSKEVGSINNSTFFCASQKVDISGYSNISFTLPIKTSSYGTLLGFGVIFFNSNNEPVGTVNIPMGDPGVKTIKMSIPANAVTVGFTWWITDEYGIFRAYVWNK